MSARVIALEARRRPARPGGRLPEGRRELEVQLGLADARRMRWLPDRAVRLHARDAGMRARADYSDGVRAGFLAVHDVTRVAAWDLGYAVGEEDAADERRHGTSPAGREPDGAARSFA